MTSSARSLVVLVALFAVLTLAGGAAAPPASAVPASRWIDVSVATLWVKPDQARAVDAPALANPADPRAWISAMSLAEKRWLVGKLETQALYGARVYLLSTRGEWSKVAVAGQPSPRNTYGYPGWVPTAQLTARAPEAAPRSAVVRSRTAWLWRSADLTGRDVLLSYGTQLPVVAATAKSVEVVLLDGRHLYLRRGAVALRQSGEQFPSPAGADVVREARKFTGLQYLWAGTSSYGVDCSGFTHLVYAALGVTIPRDGGPQFAEGTPVRTIGALRAGDLVFFRSSAGVIYHVGMALGDGRMLQAPRTGAAVTETSLLQQPWRSAFAGGRRYVP